MNMTKILKNHILFLVCRKVIFHYIWKQTNILFLHLHVKIRPCLHILEKKGEKAFLLFFDP